MKQERERRQNRVSVELWKRWEMEDGGENTQRSSQNIKHGEKRGDAGWEQK